MDRELELMLKEVTRWERFENMDYEEKNRFSMNPKSYNDDENF